MPNWCEDVDVFEIHGPKKNIVKFLSEGVEYSRYQYIIDCYSHGFIMEHTPKGNAILSLFLDDFEQAKNFEAKELAKISSKYGVDFHIFATESGMEFCQEIEVINGEITIDREVPYGDFMWEAPDPRIGG